jgi:hypothetical protein
MDGQRFDDMVKALGHGASRRRILRGIVGGIGAAALTAFGREGAHAAPDDCSQVCATFEGPQKAACKQECRECGGNGADVCRASGFPATCCPGAGAGTSQCCPDPSSGQNLCCPGAGTCCLNRFTGVRFCCPQGTTCRFDFTAQNYFCGA